MEKGSTIFITGATGFIGEKLALDLVANGYKVNALVRNPAKTPSLMNNSSVKLFKGDINEYDSVKAATDGCSYAFHLAGFVQLWHKDQDIFQRVNVEGTRTVTEACIASGIQRLVFTSTAGVFGPALNGQVSETTQRTVPLTTDYENTKLAAEKAALEYISKGIEVVIVNPTRVFGPGLISKSNAVTLLIDRYSRGKWRILPGDGKRTGNYVFIDDVVKGHQLAMLKGRSGENYIIGGDSASYSELFHKIGEITGKQHWMIPIGTPVMQALARIQQWKADLLGLEPLITPGFAKKYLYDWDNSIEKARRELGYAPATLSEGIGYTLEWLRKEKVS